MKPGTALWEDSYLSLTPGVCWVCKSLAWFTDRSDRRWAELCRNRLTQLHLSICTSVLWCTEEPLISPGCRPVGALQGEDTVWENKGLLFPPSSFLHPSVLSVKLKRRLSSASLWGERLSGDEAQGWGGSKEERSFQSSIINNPKEQTLNRSVQSIGNYLWTYHVLFLSRPSTEYTVHGQVTPPTHVYVPLAGRKGDVPSSSLVSWH